MNKAFSALSDLIPYISNKDKFMEKKNSEIIKSKIGELQSAFKAAKHDTLIKEDLFAPSYNLINENISGSLKAFNDGKKDYAHWRLKEITSLCLDCHTRMPPSHPSSFQSGELSIDKTKFDNVYNLGIAQMIVRQYVEAKMSFERSIQDKLIKKEMQDLILPYKQILLIETKVLKNPENLEKEFMSHLNNKNVPDNIKNQLREWNKRLSYWKDSKLLRKGLATDKEVETFINTELAAFKGHSLYENGRDVDLLFATGLLSNYLFINPDSKMAPEIGFWIGKAEKTLKRENFFGSGELFLKQCMRKYPKHPVAKKCYEEYEEYITFEFSGSSGTNIPKDVREEMRELKRLIK